MVLAPLTVCTSVEIAACAAERVSKMSDLSRGPSVRIPNALAGAILGHENLNTTKRYVQRTAGQLAEAAERLAY
jgi:hypothetical protein